MFPQQDTFGEPGSLYAKPDFLDLLLRHLGKIEGGLWQCRNPDSFILVCMPMIGAVVVGFMFVTAARLEPDPALEQGNGLVRDFGLVHSLDDSPLS